VTVRVRGALALCFYIACSGCVHAPAFNVLGSYFPAWMLCMSIAIIATVLVRLFVQRVHWDVYLWPTILTYPCLTAFFAFTCWLGLFS
jgi:hypothetical protein